MNHILLQYFNEKCNYFLIHNMNIVLEAKEMGVIPKDYNYTFKLVGPG